MNRTQKFVSAFALITASSLALAASPAAAATTGFASSISPLSAVNSEFAAPFAGIGKQGAEESVEYGRRFRRRRGLFGRRGFRRRRGIGIGGLLTGALIIGGIAAIADSANNNRNTRTYPRRNPNVNAVPPRQQQQQQRNLNTSNINIAAEQCASAAEQSYGNDAQLGNINRIERADNGFNVEGTIRIDGGTDTFSCGVIEGEVQYLEFGRGEELVNQ